MQECERVSVWVLSAQERIGCLLEDRSPLSTSLQQTISTAVQYILEFHTNGYKRRIPYRRDKTFIQIARLPGRIQPEFNS
ncbi:hypothetical protein DPMN_035115 [Dreissena polymorpha]|uniref:Uncharacterized protein n=1 Tax=Dreissena polymorpha TaxID=45954 RepID=A0A9D4M8X5_DREPO|nr:hypothetical protein DPMN_035115 [Dreissena polymorpha]